MTYMYGFNSEQSLSFARRSSEILVGGEATHKHGRDIRPAAFPNLKDPNVPRKTMIRGLHGDGMSQVRGGNPSIRVGCR